MKPENTDYESWNFEELYDECVKRRILKGERQDGKQQL